MRGHREDGYVMAVALVVLFAMSLGAAALVSVSASELRRTAAAEQELVLDAALEGAVFTAARQILLEPHRRDFDFSGDPVVFEQGGRAILIEAEPLQNIVDLNTAPADAVLAALLLPPHHGPTEATVSSVREYRARGEAIELPDAVFDAASTGECARRRVTVFGGGDGTPRPAAPIGRPSAGAKYSIRATMAGQMSRSKEAVILVTGRPSQPFLVMDYRLVRGAVENCDGT